ncbi:MAG: hypothetical protein GX591_20020 [Planctomycetes bacterium]|nr:hypothetical protein [Planctomycetota bacterium]
MNGKRCTWAALAVLLALPAAAGARIKLATLPVRQRVEIQLDNGAFTLVEEERIVPLLKSTPASGNNMIDFSWTNTRIDRDSVQFRPVALRDGDAFRPIRADGGQEEISVINVAYPPGENALVWEVYAAEACAAKVRVSYLISNLTRSFSYRAAADKDETTLTLRNYIELQNYSGEQYDQAGLWAGFGPRFLKPIDQQTEIRMLLQTFADVPILKTYTFDWYAHGPLNDDRPLASKVLMHYVLTNDAAHAMGVFPLQPGKVRIFIADGRGGEAFLGEDWAALTPLDGEMKLYLGEARDVVCTRTIQDNRRHAVRGDLFHQELRIQYEVENFKDKPVTLDIVEQLNALARQYGGDPHGDVEWELGAGTSPTIRLNMEEGTARPILRVELPARPKDADEKVAKQTFTFHLTLKNLW